MFSRSVSNILVQKTDAICRRLRTRWYRSLGMRLGGDVHLRRVRVRGDFSDILIEGDGTYLDDYVSLLVSGKRNGHPRIRIGKHCGFNRFTVIDACEEISFGDGARVGPGCFITDHDGRRHHGDLMTPRGAGGSPTRIGSDTWLGAGVIVTKGVTIGDGSIVGAGSVVTTDIPPMSIAVGVPARVVRARI